MLIVGHTALAYLMTRPFLNLDKSSLISKNIFFIFIFANIIDVINFSFLRYFSHTLIGIFLFTGFWLMFFIKFNIIEKRIFPLFLLAACSQIIGDYLFGEIYLFAPIINTSYTVYGGYCHLGQIAESFVFMIFYAVFVFSKDYHYMREFIHNEKQKFVKNFKIKKIFNPEFYIFYLFILFILFSIAQFGYFFNGCIDCLKNYILAPYIYLLCFILFLGIFSLIGFGKIQKNSTT